MKIFLLREVLRPFRSKGAMLAVFLLSAWPFAQRAEAQSTIFNASQPPILPQTPTSAALGKFGDYEVSMFTGLANISIPLYTIKTGGFEVPVTLAYHPSGIKLNEQAGWVGLGWALDAGGSISRAMVGQPDETGYTGFFSQLPRTALSLSTNWDPDLQYMKFMNEGKRDKGADVYSYSFPGGSGKFFYDTTYTPVLMPYTPIKIIKHTGLLSFDIRDQHGNFLQFGNNYKEMSRSNISENIGNYNVTAWMLERMISPTKKDTVKFSYVEQTSSTSYETLDTWTVDDKISDPGLGEDTNNPIPYTAGISYSSDNFVNTDFITKNLQRIDYKTGHVDFELQIGSGFKSLKQVKVYDTSMGYSTLLRTITFFYSGSLLDSLQFKDSNSNTVNSYKFHYRTDIDLSQSGNLRAKDYWGYYNGKNNNSLVPKQAVHFQPWEGSAYDTLMAIGSNIPKGREPDSAFNQLSMLRRIDFPTRGYTDFEYESNKYHDIDTPSIIRLGGGLRIKTIRSYDGGSSVPVTKSYSYGSDGTGLPNFYMNRFTFMDEQHHEYWDSLFDGSPDAATKPHPKSVTGRKRTRRFYTNPTISIQPSDGASVVYPFVTEFRGEGDNVLGKTEFRYRDSSDYTNYIPNLSITKPEVVTRFFDRGQLLSKRTYKKTGINQFQPLEEESTTYNVMTPDFNRTVKFAGLDLSQVVVKDNYDYYVTDPPGEWSWMNFYYVSDDNYPTSTVKKVYDAHDSTKYTATTTWLQYNSFAHQQVNKIITTDSKSDTLITNIRYPADYLGSSTALDTMRARNMQAVEIEKWAARLGPTPPPPTPPSHLHLSAPELVIGGMLTEYQLSGGLVVPYRQSKLNISLPAQYGEGGTDPNLEPVVLYNQFDSDGNVLELQRADGIKTSYLWEFGNNHPVAECKNAAANEFYYQSYESNPQGNDAVHAHTGTSSNMTLDFAFTKPNSKTYILSYWYLAGGVWHYTEQTYGPHALIPTAEAYDDVCIYPSDAQITTYTYNTKGDVATSTDSRGQVTFYEYDNYQRLVNVRDNDGKILKHTDYHYSGQ